MTMHDAGNITVAPKVGDETTRLHLVYDAWNRMVDIKDDNMGSPGSSLRAMAYDGLNRRPRKQGFAGFDVCFNSAWQMLEMRRDDDTDPEGQRRASLRRTFGARLNVGVLLPRLHD